MNDFGGDSPLEHELTVLAMSLLLPSGLIISRANPFLAPVWASDSTVQFRVA
jgi:hypothetical protein